MFRTIVTVNPFGGLRQNCEKTHFKIGTTQNNRLINLGLALSFMYNSLFPFVKSPWNSPWIFTFYGSPTRWPHSIIILAGIVPPTISQDISHEYHVHHKKTRIGKSISCFGYFEHHFEVSLGNYIPFCWVIKKKKRTFFNTPLNLHYILQSSPIIMLIKPIYQALEDLHRFKAPPPTRAQVTSTPWRSTSRTPRRRSMQ